MKKILLSVAIAFCAIATTNAQEHNTYNSSGRKQVKPRMFAHRDGLHITANLGLGGGNLTSTNFEDYYGLSTNSGPMFSIGVELCYLFNNHIGVGMGLQSAAYGYSVKLGQGTAEKVDIIQSYIGIPFYARFVTSKPNKLGFFTNAGFTYNALSAISEKDQDDNESTETGAYNKSAFALQIFSGICIPAGNRVSFDIGLNYQYFLTDNFNSDKVDVRGNLEYIGGKVALNIRMTK